VAQSADQEWTAGPVIQRRRVAAARRESARPHEGSAGRRERKADNELVGRTRPDEKRRSGRFVDERGAEHSVSPGAVHKVERRDGRGGWGPSRPAHAPPRRPSREGDGNYDDYVRRAGIIR